MDIDGAKESFPYAVPNSSVLSHSMTTFDFRQCSMC